MPPFITSKLQQAARFPVKKTMMIAQQLYEGVELPGEGAVGLITYMRTDSTRVSDQALTDVRQFIGETYGPDFVPEKPTYYRAKADAQDAHEAIRPTSMQYHPDAVRAHLTGDQFYLYKLIWNRFVASQMPPATFDETTVDIAAADYLFRVKGSVPKFAGWMAVYNQEPVTEDRTAGPGPDAASSDDDDATGLLPALSQGDELTLRELKPEQKFTQPPPRYSEATLVKALEENGIGRPSTYASIITVIQAREYVSKIEGRFKPTMLGMMLVEKLLSPAFDDILDVEYTSKLEEQLDEIEQGKNDYASTLESFYAKFKKDLKRAEKQMLNLKEGYEPDPPVTCDKCGKPMVIKAGKFGLFLACSGYPECENTRELEAPEAGRRRRDRGGVRELRQADGRQARPVRSVPGVHRLSGVQDDAEDHHDEAGDHRREARSDPRREVPEVRFEPRAQARTLRRVHRLQQLSELPLREAEVHGRGLPEGRRRHRRAEVTPRQGLLRLRELSGLRLHALESSDAGEVSGLRRPVPRREDHEAARTAIDLQQRGVLLRPVGGAGASVTPKRYAVSGMRDPEPDIRNCIPHSTYRIPTS